MNIANILKAAAQAHPDTVALALGERPVATYREFAAQAGALATSLRELGMAPGERVAIIMSNCPEFFPALFGCWFAGLCAVPVNAKLHTREFAYILRNSGARLCLCSDDLVERLAPLGEEFAGALRLIVAGSAEFRSLLGADVSAIAEAPPDGPAWLFYTSGTTGRPKGAILSHRNLTFMTLAYYADIDPVGPNDTMMHAAPLSHGSGLYALPQIAKASRQVITESRHFDPAEIFRLLATGRDVSFFAAPTMVTRLLAEAAVDAAPPANLKTIIYGGAPMYVADLERALAAFGPRLCQIYGQGESPMTITALPKAMHAGAGEERQRRLASCGIARTGVEVRVVDDADNPLPPGEVGEVVTRSDCVMPGYWNDAAASAETLRGGWLHTGDVGSLDEFGFLTLRDRSKDLIISGGSNIYPREIEEVLLRHPGTAEVAVVGQRDSDWGESIVAFVVARPDAEVRPAELEQLCLDHIARFKRPREYRFLDALPKNNYGKVLKTELRRMLEPPPDGAA